MDYKFDALLGAAYRGGSVVMHGNVLLTASGNRVTEVDLTHSTSSTLPNEARKQLTTLCVSPDGVMLLAVDEDGKALLINRKRRVLLHHISFADRVTAAAFSPNGAFIACAVGRVLQVWRAPTHAKVMAPLQLHRSYGGCTDIISAIDWSADDEWVAVGSKDLTCRVFSGMSTSGYTAPSLSGHKSRVVGVFFTGEAVASAARLAGVSEPSLMSVAEDGAVHTFTYNRSPQQRSTSVGYAVEEHGATSKFTGGQWWLNSRHFLQLRGAKVTAVDFHRSSGVLLTAYSSGIFELHQMPHFTHLQVLSATHHSITAVTFNDSGNWIAVGSAELGQLLVWDWRQETYVLKQQGHSTHVAAVAFSPDGAQIATAGDDSKVKVWTVSSGICVVTFTDHTAAVTGLQWLPSGSAVLSCSLDGTVRAFDLVRYRNFRTFTTPTAVQFSSMAADPSGEIVCAGSLDTFQIFVWSVKTRRLLDVLAGHTGPVVGLAFSPKLSLLASVSWDHNLRTWDVFDGKGSLEVLQHGHELLAVAFRPDGKEIATASLEGHIHFWDPLEGSLQGTIEGRRDISAGRSATDRRTAGNSTSGMCFATLAYSADGTLLFAGGRSKYICVYSTSDKVLLRRFELTLNRSLDGVLDELNTKKMTDAGSLDLINDAASDDEFGDTGRQGKQPVVPHLPGTSGRARSAANCQSLALSPTGRAWAAATTEGAVVYSLHTGDFFDPTELEEAVTPEAARQALARQHYVKALLLALRLKDTDMMRHMMLSVPDKQVASVAAAIPPSAVTTMLVELARSLSATPHLEFMLSWLRALCLHHGSALQTSGGSGGASMSSCAPAFRTVQQAVTKLHDDIRTSTEENMYALRFFCAASDTSVPA